MSQVLTATTSYVQAGAVFLGISDSRSSFVLGFVRNDAESSAPLLCDTVQRTSRAASAQS